MKGKGINPRKVSAVKDFLCVVPVLIFLAIFTYYPIAELLRISFTDWNLLKDTWQYVGFKNWEWLFNGSGTRYLWNSLRVTVLYSIGELTITIVGGMAFALIFNRMNKAFSVMRAIVFMPKYVAMSSAAVVFLWILNTGARYLNYFLSLAGIDGIEWLGDRNTALISVLMLTGWRCIGYGMMVYLSAMMGISTDYSGGFSGWGQFFPEICKYYPSHAFTYYIVPLCDYVYFFMKVFQSVDILTQGGPYRSTEVFVYNIYRYAMVDFRMDRASTVAIFFFVLLLAVTVATMKISNGRITYDS